MRIDALVCIQAPESANHFHVEQVWRLCRMRHSRHYAASGTMPRVGVRAAIHGHLNNGDAA
jgi:hypothetical protein